MPILFPINNHRNIIAMLGAYFDASRQKTPDELRREVTCVAGFLSPIRKWKSFQHRWQRLLYKERLEYFHMTDFENYQGPYKQWTKKRHQDFLRKALWIIKDNVNFGFASALALDDFEQAKKADIRLESMSAFTFCIIQCLHAIEQQENRFGYNGSITYTFESGDGYDNELRRLEQEIRFDPRKEQRFRLGSWTTADKRELNPLQAADICAYEGAKEMVHNKVPGTRLRKARISALALFHGMNCSLRCHNLDGLNRLGQRLDEPATKSSE